ncbi:ABC transporter ATP-binding protein [Bosea sp. LjRoot9]|uniref:ABC transporter ATP-binding protein n=1 Tax=Bosea sp. LjRoot9 TaxID=3342341 RepID=UPI003ECC32A4
MTDLLTVSGLCARYGRYVAVSDVGLSVKTGAVAALLGANGAGKSTTLKAIAGLVRAEGSIIFDGEAVESLSTRQRVHRGIVYVPEGRQIVATLSVGENLTLGGYHVDGSLRAQRQQMVLDLFPEIANRVNRPAWMLSGGEQQMLAIGRALMAGPRLLLLDEPSLGLAPLLVKRVFERLEVVRGQTNLSVVLVEQNFRMSVQLAEEVYFMRGGRIVSRHPASALRTPSARQDAINSYLGPAQGHDEPAALILPT